MWKSPFLCVLGKKKLKDSVSALHVHDIEKISWNLASVRPDTARQNDQNGQCETLVQACTVHICHVIPEWKNLLQQVLGRKEIERLHFGNTMQQLP